MQAPKKRKITSKLIIGKSVVKAALANNVTEDEAKYVRIVQKRLRNPPEFEVEISSDTDNWKHEKHQKCLTWSEARKVVNTKYPKAARFGSVVVDMENK
jgi:hypothetical protein